MDCRGHMSLGSYFFWTEVLCGSGKNSCKPETPVGLLSGEACPMCADNICRDCTAATHSPALQSMQLELGYCLLSLCSTSRDTHYALHTRLAAPALGTCEGHEAKVTTQLSQQTARLPTNNGLCVLYWILAITCVFATACMAC